MRLVTRAERLSSLLEMLVADGRIDVEHSADHFGVSAATIRRDLDYLADRRLIELVKQPSGAWFADLSRLGVDIVEYTIDCQPGIARPEKYWEG